MPKFELEFEVQELKIAGLRIRVKGDREDAQAAQAIGQRITALINPPVTDIIDAEPVTNQQPLFPGIGTANGKKKSVQRKRPGNSQVSSATNGKELVIDWIHETEKWGTPQQAWKTADKSVWLLYVVNNQLDVKEMTSASITETFNKHFRQSGIISTRYVSRDLGKYKKETPPLVSEDTTKVPSAWFLTDAGIKKAEQLVMQARGVSITGSKE
jgi:hypothetical protein